MSGSRSVAGRLRALERKARVRGSCGVCGGEGAPGLVFQFEGEEPLRQPEPCPGCGRAAPTVFRIIEALGGERGRRLARQGYQACDL